MYWANTGYLIYMAFLFLYCEQWNKFSHEVSILHHVTYVCCRMVSLSLTCLFVFPDDGGKSDSAERSRNRKHPLTVSVLQGARGNPLLCLWTGWPFKQTRNPSLAGTRRWNLLACTNGKSSTRAESSQIDSSCKQNLFAGTSGGIFLACTMGQIRHTHKIISIESSSKHNILIQKLCLLEHAGKSPWCAWVD